MIYFNYFNFPFYFFLNLYSFYYFFKMIKYYIFNDILNNFLKQIFSNVLDFFLRKEEYQSVTTSKCIQLKIRENK